MGGVRKHTHTHNNNKKTSRESTTLAKSDGELLPNNHFGISGRMKSINCMKPIKRKWCH